MSIFDVDADQEIAKTIEELCRELRHVDPTDENYGKIVDNIAKLRASLNPCICPKD